MGKDHPAFIHSKLDEFGLSCSEFRVYCHVARVAGVNGSCFERLETMCSIIGCHIETARKALKSLLQQGLLNVSFRGTSNEYRLTPIAKWKSCEALGKNHSAALGKKHRSNTASPRKKPSVSPRKKPSSLYIEGNLHKVIPKPSPEVAQEIYDLYPLKVGKPKAITAILKALKKVSVDYLKERTVVFAKARNGDTAFCPHPTTWFNQERYNDNPSTWGSKHDTTKPTRQMSQEEMLREAIS